MLHYEMAEVEEAPYLYNERTCSTDPGDISRNMGPERQGVRAHGSEGS